MRDPEVNKRNTNVVKYIFTSSILGSYLSRVVSLSLLVQNLFPVNYFVQNYRTVHALKGYILHARPYNYGYLNEPSNLSSKFLCDSGFSLTLPKVVELIII